MYSRANNQRVARRRAERQSAIDRYHELLLKAIADSKKGGRFPSFRTLCMEAGLSYGSTASYRYLKPLRDDYLTAAKEAPTFGRRLGMFAGNRQLRSRERMTQAVTQILREQGPLAIEPLHKQVRLWLSPTNVSLATTMRAVKRLVIQGAIGTAQGDRCTLYCPVQGGEAVSE